MAEIMEQYELRSNTFSGSDHEDANEHIEKVLEIVDLFHIPNITVDQVMLRAFPMSLTGAASRWLRNKPTGSITTWEDLKAKFLSKYCPPARTAKKMEEINNFQQEPNKNLYQAWERFKELLMKCPQPYLMKMQEVVLFYNGLDVPTRQILNSKGAIPSKTAADAKVAIQEMAEYSQKWHNGTSRATSTETSDGLAVIQAQLNNLGRVIKNVNEKIYAAQLMKALCLIGSNHYAVSTDMASDDQNIILSYKSRQATIPFPIRLGNHYCEEEDGSFGPKFIEAYGASNVYDTIPQKEKDPGSFALPCMWGSARKFRSEKKNPVILMILY
ncbi:retrovirus-related pol polyprotein from transposon TNT 1-94 [Tanacetum coccineum]